MKIKMTLREIQSLDLPQKGDKDKPAISLLGKIINAPVINTQSSYWLTRIANKIIGELTDLNKSKDKLVKGYLIDAPLPKDAKPDTKPGKIIDPKKLEELNKKWDDFLGTEITLDINSKIKLEWLEGIDLTNRDLMLLDKLIESGEKEAVNEKK